MPLYISVLHLLSDLHCDNLTQLSLSKFTYLWRAASTNASNSLR